MSDGRAAARTKAGPGIGALVEMLRRRRGLALLCTVLPATVAVGLAVALPNVYRAQATVLVEPAQVQESARPTDPEGVDARLEAIREEVLSRARLKELIDQFDLYPQLRARLPEEEVIGRLRRDIGMEVRAGDPRGGPGGTIAFALSYRGTDPALVAGVANALASMYVDANTRIREGQSSSTAEFLRARLDEVQATRDGQEKRISEFKLQHANELPEQVGANLATLERLNTQLKLNNENQSRLAERRDKLAGAVGSGVAGDDADSRTTRLAKLRDDLRALQVRYKDSYPDVARLKEAIAALEREDAASPGPTGKPAPDGDAASPGPTGKSAPVGDGQMRALKLEEKRLRADIDTYQARVENASRREQELRDLSRDRDANEEAYASLRKRYDEARFAGTMEEGHKGERFRILDSAVPPTLPMAPNRLKLLLMGLVLAAGLGAAAVFLAEQVDTSFHDPDDLRALEPSVAVVSIPRIVSRRDTRRARARSALRAAATLLVLALLAAGTYHVASGNDDLVWALARGQR